MSQGGAANLCTLPGIVTDQPEIYESEPAPSDDTGINDPDNNEPDEAVGLIEIPIHQAFSYFAERENEIAKFYVQKQGEYRISGNRPDEETDIEKYHRLVGEVNQLLSKFQADKAARSDDKAMSVTTNALTSNLEVLAKQLKALEFAAEDGSLNPTQAGFTSVKSRLDQLKEKVDDGLDPNTMLDARMTTDETSRVIRMSALERRLNALENSIGKDEDSMMNLFRATKCDSLIEAAERLGSWLALTRRDNLQQINGELDFMIQRLEKMKEKSESGAAEESRQLDVDHKSKLEHLYNLVTSTDKQRAMVPTILHRLNAMEELQQKAAQVATTINHLEQIQSQIVDNLHANKVELTSLTEMFAKNIDLMKQFSTDIDNRIASIREKGQT